MIRARRRGGSDAVLYLAVGLAYLALRLVYATGDPWTHDQTVPGNLAHALIHGRALPWWLYQIPEYAHGTLLLTPLVWAGFRLFGEINAVNVGVIVGVTLATCLAWVRLADRYGSRRLAWGIGIAFVLAPPYWNFLAVKLWGLHTEACLPIAIQFLVLLRLLDAGMTWRGSATLGVLSGLSTMFFLHNVPAVAVIVALWLLRDGFRMAAPRIALYLALVAAFFLPVVWYNHAYGEIGFVYFANRYPGVVDAGGWLPWARVRFLNKAVALAAVVLPRAVWFPTPWQTRAYMAAVGAGAVVAVAAVASAIASSRGERPWARLSRVAAEHPLPAIAVLFPPAFAGVYVLGTMEVLTPQTPHYYRYLVTLFPIFFLLLALLFERGGAAAIPLALAVLLGIGAPEIPPFGHGRAALALPQAVAFFRARGYDPWRICTTSVPLYLASLPAAERLPATETILARARGAERAMAAQAFGLLFDRLIAEPGTDPRALLSRLAPGDRARFVEGVGMDLGDARISGIPRTRSMADWLAVLRDPPDGGSGAALLVRGLGWGAVAYLTGWRPHGWRDEIRNAAANGGASSAADPGGPMNGRLALRRWRELAAAVPGEDVESFVVGTGIGLGEGYEGDADRFPILSLLLPDGDVPRREEAFAEGIGYGVTRYAVRFHEEIPDGLLREYLRYETPREQAARRGLERFLADWGLALLPVPGHAGTLRFAEADAGTARPPAP